MLTTQAPRNGQVHAGPMPDPEVPERPVRRRFSAEYKLAILDMEQMATNLATRIEGRSEQKLIRDHHVWFDLIARPAIAPRAREAIAGHRSRGDLIVLCTGATQFTANELSAALDIEHVISTRLEVVDGTFTGRLESIAFLEHKLDRTEQFAVEHHVNLDGSWFYSDSFNDLPLMTRVGTPVAVNPDRRLRRHAARQGWKVESWR